LINTRVGILDQYEGWHTIRDTQEELLSLIALQVKNRELRNIQKEIRRAKRKLFKYRSPFIKEKMRQRKEQNPELQEQSEEHSTPETNNDVVMLKLEKNNLLGFQVTIFSCLPFLNASRISIIGKSSGEVI